MVSAIGDPDSSSTDGARPIQRASVGATKAPTPSRTGVARGGRRTVAVTTLRARPAGGGRARNSSLRVTSHVVRASGGQETCPSHDDRSARNLHQPEAISSRSCIAGPGTRRSDRSALVPVGRRSRPPSLLRSSPVSCGDSQESMDAKVARFVLHSRTANFERGLWGAAARGGVLDECSPQNSSLDPTARLRLAAGQHPYRWAH
jgi:hypothetical protein